MAEGWINGKVRIAELEPDIQDRTDALKRKGIAVPKLGCTDEDTENFQKFKANLKAQMEREEAEYQQASKQREALRKKRMEEAEEDAKEEAEKQKVKEVKEVKQRQEEDDDDEGEEEQEVGAKKVTAHMLPWMRKGSGSPWKGEEDLPETDAGLAKSVMGSEMDIDWQGPSKDKDEPLENIGSVQTLPVFTQSRGWLRSWWAWLVSVLVNILIAFLCAWIYDKYRFRPKMIFAPKAMAIQTGTQDPGAGISRHWPHFLHVQDDFGVGLFSCFQDPKLCMFSCCCPCLRWADTLDRAGLLKYWVGFTVFAVLASLSPYTFGITGLLLVFICFRYRQRLRKKYSVAPNNFQDCLAYLFCGTCAIVQEARVEANRPL